MDVKLVAQKIKAFREMRGYSQEYMGVQLGMSATSYGELEGGKHKLDVGVLDKIAEVLHVDVWVFIQPGPTVLVVRDNHHNTNVGYNQVEHQHTVPEALLERVLTAHERLIALMERHLGKDRTHCDLGLPVHSWCR